MALLSATAVLDFPSVGIGADEELTITVPGALVGDAVMLGLPATFEADLIAFAFVTAANTVTVRVVNHTGAVINPASGTFRVCLDR
jgi:hypothetical protein